MAETYELHVVYVLLPSVPDPDPDRHEWVLSGTMERREDALVHEQTMKQKGFITCIDTETYERRES